MTPAVASHDSSLKVLQVHNIANVPAAISAGLNRIGVSSTLLEYRDPFHFEAADYSLELDRKNLIELGIARAKNFVWAMRNFDIVHLHSAALLPAYLEGPLTRLLPFARAKLVYSHWGADIRQGAPPLLSRVNCAKRFVCPDLYDRAPDAEVLPVCVDLDYWKPVSRPAHERPVVLHAPTNRAFKNTDAVLRAVDKWRKEGLDFEFRLVENVPLPQLKAELENCDILLDQFNTWYATLACEAMALAKPVAATLRPDIRERHAPDCPIVNCEPDGIADSVRDLILDAGLRNRVGRQSLAFAKKRHDCVVVARRLKEVYTELVGAG
ncbi:glycosyltransferase family 4 protein [Candidatus Micrarchaeota archaeon]|nr:glycosyltransferase family 4 protein [Candidatus Micrarchaeota archaeon]